MMRSVNWGICLCLLAAISQSAFAQESAAQAQVVSVFASPAGVLETFGGVRVNGRAAQWREAIWGGELIEVGAQASARVLLPAAGQVTLPAGSRARLAVTSDAKLSRAILIASLLDGALAVTLQPACEAYVEAGGLAYVATAGAAFRLTLRGDKAVLTIASGAVREVAELPQTKITITPVGIDRSITKTKTNGSKEVKARFTRPKGSGGPSVSGESAETLDMQGQGQEPVVNTPVSFVLTPATLGTINPTRTFTDANGIATANFLAGSRTGKGKLRITAEETGDFVDWDVEVMSPFGYWVSQNKALVAIGVTAAVAVPVVLVTTRNDNRIRPVPPPVIVP
jgi:hypothetical protein